MITEQERTTEKKLLFLEEYEKCLAIVTVTSSRTGIDRRTFYRWRESDDDFKRKCENIARVQMGYVHDLFLKKIADGNRRGIGCYLRSIDAE